MPTALAAEENREHRPPPAECSIPMDAKARSRAGGDCRRSSKPGLSGARAEVLAYGAEQAHASVRRDVLVQPEEVRRIVGALERLQPLVLVGTVGLPDPLLALIHQEVHVDAGVVGRKRGREGPGPLALDVESLGGLA